MRLGLFVLALATLVGCGPTGGDDTGYYSPPGGTDPVDTGCKADTDCTPDVCARDGECLSADEVQHISATWTVAGAAASDASCTSEPSLEIQFSNPQEPGDGVGFAPVPCNEGKFTVDKMPTRFSEVSLGDEDGSTSLSSDLDGSGNVTFDLP